MYFVFLCVYFDTVINSKGYCIPLFHYCCYSRGKKVSFSVDGREMRVSSNLKSYNSGERLERAVDRPYLYWLKVYIFRSYCTVVVVGIQRWMRNGSWSSGMCDPDGKRHIRPHSLSGQRMVGLQRKSWRLLSCSGAAKVYWEREREEGWMKASWRRLYLKWGENFKHRNGRKTSLAEWTM